MAGWVLGRISWFAAGAVTAVVGGVIVRPLLVSAVKAGIGVKSAVKSALQQAQVEAAKIRAEAQSIDTSNLSKADQLGDEMRRLRDEVASLKKVAMSDKAAAGK